MQHFKLCACFVCWFGSKFGKNAWTNDAVFGKKDEEWHFCILQVFVRGLSIYVICMYWDLFMIQFIFEIHAGWRAQHSPLFKNEESKKISACYSEAIACGDLSLCQPLLRSWVRHIMYLQIQRVLNKIQHTAYIKRPLKDKQHRKFWQ